MYFRSSLPSTFYVAYNGSQTVSEIIDDIKTKDIEVGKHSSVLAVMEWKSKDLAEIEYCLKNSYTYNKLADVIFHFDQ